MFRFLCNYIIPFKNLFPTKHNQQMKKIITFMFSAILVAGCSPGSDDLSSAEKAELIKNVQEDASFKELAKLQNSHMLAIAKDYYGHSSSNGNIIKDGLRNCKSGEQVIELYKKAGFKHADEYVETTNRMVYLNLELKKKHPELAGLSKAERKQLFSFPSPTANELKSIATSRQKSLK